MNELSNIKETLMGRRILIVEDNDSLAQRVRKEFGRYGSEVSIKHTIESGLAELKENGSTYDLIIVDVRLPAKEKDYDTIKEIIKKLDECYEILLQESEATPCSEVSEKEEKAQESRSSLLELLSPLIRETGGIEMVKKWLCNSDKAKHPPILYFSAVADNDIKQNGIKAAGGKNVEWLVKPVSGENLMKIAVDLILEMPIAD